MINLPSELTPSELLYCDDLPPFIDKLLEGSRSLRREGRLSEAERCALDALEGGHEPGVSVSQAVTLVHLADVHRDMGKLGPVLTNCRRAYRIFQRQVSRYQRHNEAVTAYALGLAHQLLGSEMDALRWYQEAEQLFERVKDDWTAVNDLTQVETCDRVRQWMETLGEHLTAARTQPDAGLASRIWVPIIPSGENGGGFAMAKMEIDSHIVGRRLTINGTSFRMHPLIKDQQISLSPGVEYYALRIPNEVHKPLGTREGDYALIVRRKDADKEGPGILETLSGPEFGNFKRDDEGKINFILPDAEVIGGEDIGDDFQIGYIAALLKPT